MRNSNPTISVLMAVYNGEKFIRQTLNSVATQTFEDWECIIVNDCSTDGTLDILNEYAAKDDRFVIHTNEQNLRLAKSLNAGLELARGKYIARFDADDISLPNRFERQVAFMEAHPEYSLSCPMHYILKNDVVTTGCCGRYDTPEAINAMLLFFCPIIHPGVIAKSEVMRKYRYDPAHTCSEDMELWTRMVMNGEKLGYQKEFLLLYRIHDGQITHGSNDKQKREVKIIESRYYEHMLGITDSTLIDFLVDQIYFHDKDDLGKLIKLYQLIISQNKTKKLLSDKMIFIAIMEVIAELKQVSGISKKQLFTLAKLGPVKFVREYVSRKKRISKEISESMEVAQKWGYDFIEKIDNIIPTFKYKEYSK